MKENNILENYAADKYLINEYHIFISKVFPSISFKDWYSKGFWASNFIPYSIIDSGKIISNVCVSLMSLWLNGQKINALQIGAVGTLPEYRNQGLSRVLLNYVLDKYEKNTDLIFLFANETVMDFYPKFGFTHVEEKLFLLVSDIPEQKNSVRKLNIDVESDYNILLNLINNRKNISNKFGAEDYGHITMWHVLNIYFDDLYYLEDDDIIIIKREKDNVLHIYDVIYRSLFDFEILLPKIIGSNSVKAIKYYFSPDQLNFRYNKTIKDNSGLFVRGEFNMKDKFFKFPETAHT